MTTNKEPLYVARSAGAAEKPKKSENILDLVEFLQTYEVSQPEQPIPALSSPTQLPVRVQGVAARGFLKAGQRRLRLLAQRQKKTPCSKLQPGGQPVCLATRRCKGSLTAPEPKTSATQQTTEALLSRPKNLDSMHTNLTGGAEGVGRPSLANIPDKGTTQDKEKRSLSVLAPHELTSMISTSEPECSVQPGAPGRGHTSERQANVTEKTLVSANDNDQKACGPAFPVCSTVGTDNSSDVTSGRAISTTSQPNEIPNTTAASVYTEVPNNSNASTQCRTESQQGDSNMETTHHEPKVEIGASAACSPSKRSYSQPLKLFPDTPQPRRRATRTSSRISRSSASSSSTIAELRENASQDTETRISPTVTPNNPLQSVDPILKAKDFIKAQPFQNSAQDAKSSGSKLGKKPKPDEEAGGHLVAAKRGTVPALPSATHINIYSATPKPEQGEEDNLPGKDNTDGLSTSTCISWPSVSQASSVPQNGQKTQARQDVRPTFASSFELTTSMQRRLDQRARSSGAVELSQVAPTLLRAGYYDQGKRGIRVASPKGYCQSCLQLDIERLQAMSQRQRREPAMFHRRSAEFTAETGRRTPRSVMSEFPTPPPRSPLPSDPPVRPRTADPFGRRRFNSQTNLSVARIGYYEATLPHARRSSQISRSGSTRSAETCREAMNSKEEHHGYLESPIRSSDDEGSGMVFTHPLRDRQQRVQGAGNGVDVAASHLIRVTGKGDQFNPTKTSPLQDQNRESLWTASPQSSHSGYTRHSQGSQASYPSSTSSVAYSLEARIAHLEEQNRILHTALTTALVTNGNLSEERLSNGIAAPSPVSRSSSNSGSYSSVADKLISRPKHGKGDGTKSSRCCSGSQVRLDCDTTSNFGISNSRCDLGRYEKVGRVKENIEHGWLPSLERTKTIRGL